MSLPAPADGIDIARRHLEAMWDEPASTFKCFDSTPIPPPKSLQPIASRSADIHDIMGMGRSTAGSSGSSSSSSSSSHHSADPMDLEAAQALALDEMRDGWVPFGTLSTVVLKKATVTKRKVDRLTEDCMSAVSPASLPTMLGRKDQLSKRLHEPDPRPVTIVPGERGVDATVAARMGRAQASSRNGLCDERPGIVWACVHAFRKTAR